jgi:uncharacterized protein YifE (UPF0438 family)
MSDSGDNGHEAYLRRRDFDPQCSLKIFDERERRDLKRYGHWLQALARGEIEPESEAQERFVDLIQHDERPEASEGTGAYFADIWWRYRRRVEWEKGGA